jgi:acyl-CoA reductase-like NAD-dependent aldehyde dehydrogenase
MSPTSAIKFSATEAGTTKIPMLIGGEWRAASESYDVRDPYRGTLVARAPHSSQTNLDDVLNAAVQAKAKAASGLLRVALELGGNGVTIVHQDVNDVSWR